MNVGSASTGVAGAAAAGAVGAAPEAVARRGPSAPVARRRCRIRGPRRASWWCWGAAVGALQHVEVHAVVADDESRSSSRTEEVAVGGDDERIVGIDVRPAHSARQTTTPGRDHESQSGPRVARRQIACGHVEQARAKTNSCARRRDASSPCSGDHGAGRAARRRDVHAVRGGSGWRCRWNRHTL